MKSFNYRPALIYIALVAILTALAGSCITGSDDIIPPPPAPPETSPPTMFQTSVFTPDGQWVYFIKTYGLLESELWKIRVDGTEEQKVINNQSPQSFITNAWISPNGANLFFMETEFIPPYSVQKWTFIADLDGTNIVDLNIASLPWAFNVSPDGKTVIVSDYCWDASGIVGRLWAIDTTNLSASVLTTAECDFKSISYSPDGGKIAAVKTLGCPIEMPEIHIMNSDGSGYQTTYQFLNEHFWPDISHSVTNDWIYYSDFAGLIGPYQKDIFRISWDGSTIENLTNTPDASETNPIVRPDQGKILYSSYSIADNYAFWEMDPDGSNKQKLIGFTGVHALNPQYSPDGNTIVYETGPLYDCNLGIFVRDVITAPTTLTSQGATTEEHELGNRYHDQMDIDTRRAEAFWNLKALADAQFAYYATYVTFTDDAAALGWQPLGDYRFSYGLGITGSEFYSAEALADPFFPGIELRWLNATPNQFSATATANLDDDYCYDIIQVSYTPADIKPRYSIPWSDFVLN